MGQPLQKQSEHRQVLDCLTKCLQCVCKESPRDPPAAAPFRAVLSMVKERNEERMGQNRVDGVNLGAAV